MTLTVDRTSSRPRPPRIHTAHRTPVRRAAIGAGAAGIAREISALRSRPHGLVVLPDDAGWDAAREAWNLSTDEPAAAIVRVTSLEDVVEVAAFARARGLRIAPRGGELWAIALLQSGDGGTACVTSTRPALAAHGARTRD